MFLTVSLLASLAVGFVIGAVVWHLIRKPYPTEFEPVAEAVNQLSAELSKVDKEIAVLINKAGYGENFERVRINIKTIGASGRIDALTKLINAARMTLEGYRKDIKKLEPFLGPTTIIRTRNEAFVKEESKDLPRMNEQSQEGEGTVNIDQGLETISLTEEDIQTSEQFSGLRTPEELIGLYNRAVTDPVASARFRERYQPLRIATTNAVERRQNPMIAEEFKEATNGDFFAVEILGRQTHAVVPRLGLTIEAVSLNAGALAKVFGITEYDNGQFYSRYQIGKPAIFRRDGDNWLLDRPGQLHLGDPD